MLLTSYDLVLNGQSRESISAYNAPCISITKSLNHIRVDSTIQTYKTIF